MAKHTPKPWSVSGKSGDETTHPELTIESDFGQVATVTTENCDDDDQVLADAVLMAAAPDLLEALKVALKFMEQDRVDTYYDPRSTDLEIVRNAIQKATI